MGGIIILYFFLYSPRHVNTIIVTLFFYNVVDLDKIDFFFFKTLGNFFFCNSFFANYSNSLCKEEHKMRQRMRNMFGNKFYKNILTHDTKKRTKIIYHFSCMLQKFNFFIFHIKFSVFFFRFNFLFELRIVFFFFAFKNRLQ